jgi:hypothetical protein
MLKSFTFTIKTKIIPIYDEYFILTKSLISRLFTFMNPVTEFLLSIVGVARVYGRFSIHQKLSAIAGIRRLQFDEKIIHSAKPSNA